MSCAVSIRCKGAVKALVLTCLLVICLSGRAIADEPPGAVTTLLHGSIASTMVLNGIDLAQTMYLIGCRHGAEYDPSDPCFHLREANPAYAPFVTSPEIAGAVKMGAAVIQSLVLLKLHERHRRLALAISLSSNVFLGYIVAHNARIAR